MKRCTAARRVVGKFSISSYSIESTLFFISAEQYELKTILSQSFMPADGKIPHACFIFMVKYILRPCSHIYIISVLFTEYSFKQFLREMTQLRPNIPFSFNVLLCLLCWMNLSLKIDFGIFLRVLWMVHAAFFLHWL